MSLRSPHKDVFVFSIHTSGHKVGPLKHCQTLALISLFLCSLKCRYGTCSTSFKTESIESDCGERYRRIKVSVLETEELGT